MQDVLAFATAKRWVLCAGVALAALVGCGGDEKKITDESCMLDTDCVSTPDTPYCSAERACVGCLENAHCTTTGAPVCDQGTHTCRGCSADNECASGVCLAAEGTCAVPSQIVYINAGFGVNNPTCDDKTPCKTMAHAKTLLTGTRNVIRLIGDIGESIEFQTKVHIDSDGGTWSGNTTPLNIGTRNGAVTLEGMSLQGPAGPASQPAVQCLNNASLRLHDVMLSGAGGNQPGIFGVCNITITKSHIFNNPGGAVFCDGNSLTIEDTLLRNNQGRSIDATGCAVRLARNQIISLALGQPAVALTAAPSLTVENNLILERAFGTATGLKISNGPTGGVIRFNTLVNIAPNAHTGDGITCDGTSVVTSNVIAWQNGLQQGGNACARRYNAFDASTAVGAGEGNTSGTMAALFVNPASDFHLAAGSPAHALAEPAAKIAVDLDGKPRPAEGRLDAGAYETP